MVKLIWFRLATLHHMQGNLSFEVKRWLDQEFRLEMKRGPVSLILHRVLGAKSI